MLKENQLIEVSFCPSVIEWYRSLGYDKKLNEKFFVKPDELTPRSNKKVIAVCDRCGKEYTVHHKDMNKKNNKLSNLQVMTLKEHTSLHSKLRKK